MKGHFWYSQKQADHYKSESSNLFGKDRKLPKNFCFINGKEYLYTALTDSKDISTYGWDDMEYLGEGDYSRSIGYW